MGDRGKPLVDRLGPFCLLFVFFMFVWPFYKVFCRRAGQGIQSPGGPLGRLGGSFGIFKTFL